MDTLPPMTSVPEAFLLKSRSLLVSDYLPKIERSLERLSDDDVWWRANEASNSIGNLVLHLCGNVTQWIIGGVGGRPFERHRQREFDERTHIATRGAPATATGGCRGSRAGDRRAGRRRAADQPSDTGYDVTVLEAVYHVVEHFGMHSGQIILLSKARTGADLRLWEPPGAASA